MEQQTFKSFNDSERRKTDLSSSFGNFVSRVLKKSLILEKTPHICGPQFLKVCHDMPCYKIFEVPSGPESICYIILYCTILCNLLYHTILNIHSFRK